jgi:hypothetical protein
MRNTKVLTTTLILFALMRPVVTAADQPSQKIDQFDGLDWEGAMARLDNFALELNSIPNSIGVIIVYGGRRGRRGEAQAWGKCLKDYVVSRRGISADRIVLVNGGYRDSIVVEIWQSVSKESLPNPAPTVDPKDVKFRKGKIKRWRSLCNI